MNWKNLPANQVAAWILASLFSDEGGASMPGERSGTLTLTGYQEAAVRRAKHILARRSGVLIADDVGLGKTFVALALMEHELERGGIVVVAVPAALRPVWKRALGRWSGHARRGRLHLVSHAQLSRGTHPAALAGRVGLVIVDEAHRFRNPGTRRHLALAELCAGARVALVTATPLNNDVADLFGLLRLFAADHAFADVGVTSLRALFGRAGWDARQASAAASHLGMSAVRRILREVMVRRTRSMLRVAGNELRIGRQTLRFPHRAAPDVVRYQEPQLAAWVRTIEALELAPFTISDGGHPATGGQTALVRLGLLKRLDSSRAALERSTRRQQEFFRAFLTALEGGRVLRPRPFKEGSGGGDFDPLQLVLLDLIAEPCRPDLDRRVVEAALRRDIGRFQSILDTLAGQDPKIEALAGLVAASAEEKVLIFTEFRDTAAAIWRRLIRSGRVGRIDGGGAWLGHLPAGRGTVIERFAPRSNGAREPSPRERVDVLIATDVLAEGLNLQDARHVVCFDMPWNPVRVMQRVGRIDRPGSPHETIVPHLFLPANGLEEVLGLARRLRGKLDAIGRTVGGDEAMALLAGLGGSPSVPDFALGDIELQGDDPIERLRLAWQALASAEHAGPATSGPMRTGQNQEASPVPVAWVDAEDAPDIQAIVLARAMGRARLLQVSHGGRASEVDTVGASIIEHALAAAPRAGSASRRIDRQAASACLAAQSCLDTLTAACRAPRAATRGEPAARLARSIRAALAMSGRWLDPVVVARADRALQGLDRPLPARLVRSAHVLAGQLHQEGDIESLLDRIDPLLEAARNVESPGPPASEETAILAVLLVAPGQPRRR